VQEALSSSADFWHASQRWASTHRRVTPMFSLETNVTSTVSVSCSITSPTTIQWPRSEPNCKPLKQRVEPHGV